MDPGGHEGVMHANGLSRWNIEVESIDMIYLETSGHALSQYVI